jgi:CRISPR-associated endonuclease Csn1
MKPYKLGLDVGSNSIGWTVIREDATPGDSERIIAGVRVFPEGVAQMNTSKEQPRGQQRRAARSARRVVHRRRLRKSKLRRILQLAGLLPADRDEYRALLAAKPYVVGLRAKALDERLEPHELGRVIYHLCQRRGFKSNRKAAGESDGKIAKATTELQQQIDGAGCRTLGEYLHRMATDHPLDRIRNRYTLRTMYERELGAIWESQRRFHEHLLTDGLFAGVKEAIFFHRPVNWERSTVGMCELEPGEARCRRAHWYGQQFRMLQEIAHLRVIDPLGEERALTDEQRNALIAALGPKKELSFDKIKDLLDLTENHRFTLVEGNLGKRDKLFGNQVEAALRTKLGKWYTGAAPELREEVWNALADVEDEGDLRRMGLDRWGLSEEQTGKLLKIDVPTGRFNVSLKAIKKMLPHLQAGKVYSEAKELAGYQHKKDIPVLDKLPPVDQWLTYLTNPVVRRSLGEVRKVVNTLVREYGKPTAIHVELARDAKESTRRRQEIHRENLDRKAENDEIRERLVTEFNILSPSRDDILKYRLWEECHHECPYSGKPIPGNKLFTPDVEIEHIIPYSRCLDDSYMNKTLCDQSENRTKHNRTPYEAYGDQPARYEAILQRAAKLRAPWGKKRRFSTKEVKLDEFVSRQLNDTRYASRLLREYLLHLGCDVICTRGQMTAELRRQWGLDTILDEHHSGVKPRHDHRQHAIDAAVIAMTSRSALQQLARIRFDPRRQRLDPPWETFRDDVGKVVDAINVSHRPRRKVSGPLHKQTSYGPTSQPNTYVHRETVGALTPAMLEDIRDPVIKKIVLDECARRGIDLTSSKPLGKALTDPPIKMPSGVPIKRVRILTRSDAMIPFRTQGDRLIKAVTPGENHHVEIFETTDLKGRKVWTGRIVSRFEAHRRMREGQPVVDRRGRDGETFVMSLCNNDMVLLPVAGNRVLCRVEWLSVIGAPDICFRLHSAASREDNATRYRFRSWRKLAEARPEKVAVDPIGRVGPAND